MRFLPFFLLLALPACTDPDPAPAPPTAAPPAAERPATAVSPVIIDVRTPAEYDAGHVAGAVLIPHEQIGERIAAVVADKGTPIALYCASGRRAGIAQQTLHAMGYTNVENVGGLDQARARFEPQP